MTQNEVNKSEPQCMKQFAVTLLVCDYYFDGLSHPLPLSSPHLTIPHSFYAVILFLERLCPTEDMQLKLKS